jgi:hypothetical protein
LTKNEEKNEEKKVFKKRLTILIKEKLDELPQKDNSPIKEIIGRKSITKNNNERRESFI